MSAETLICPNCGRLNNPDRETCKACNASLAGASGPPQQAKKGRGKLLMVAAIGAVLLCALCGLASLFSNPGQQTANAPAAAPPAAVAVAEATPTVVPIAALGDTIQSGEWEIVVQEAARADMLTWNDEPLWPDGQWLILYGQARNTTVEEASLLSGDFKLTAPGLTGEIDVHRDATGAAGNAADVERTVAGFGGLEIPGGESYPLVLAFDVPPVQDVRLHVRSGEPEQVVNVGMLTEIAVIPTPIVTDTPPPSWTPVPTDTPVPTQPPAPTQASPTQQPPADVPQSAPAVISSNGIGMLRSDWEALHGAGQDIGGFWSYEDGTYIVAYLDGRLWFLERAWPQTVSLDGARTEGRSYIPADATFLETYVPYEDRLADLYHSVSLATVFSSDRFIGGKPGDVLVIYRSLGDQVSSIVIGLGNNP